VSNDKWRRIRGFDGTGKSKSREKRESTKGGFSGAAKKYVEVVEEVLESSKSNDQYSQAPRDSDDDDQQLRRSGLAFFWTEMKRRSIVPTTIGHLTRVTRELSREFRGDVGIPRTIQPDHEEDVGPSQYDDESDAGRKDVASLHDMCQIISILDGEIEERFRKHGLRTPVHHWKEDEIGEFIDRITSQSNIPAYFHPWYGIVVNLEKALKVFEEEYNLTLCPTRLRFKAWSEFVRFLIFHELFHYWTHEVSLSIDQQKGMEPGYTDWIYSEKIPRMDCSLDESCYERCKSKGYPVGLGTISGSRRLTEIGAYDERVCTANCRASGHWAGWQPAPPPPGYQYPLEECLANAFGGRRSHIGRAQRLGRMGPVQMGKGYFTMEAERIREFIEGICTDSQPIGYSEHMKFKRLENFDAGLRDMSLMLRGEKSPTTNSFHDSILYEEDNTANEIEWSRNKTLGVGTKRANYDAVPFNNKNIREQYAIFIDYSGLEGEYIDALKNLQEL